MNQTAITVSPPFSAGDWLSQRELAEILGVSQRTASLWATAGRLQRYEHGFPNCGHRKYSKALLALERQTQWERAVHRQRDLMPS